MDPNPLNSPRRRFAAPLLVLAGIVTVFWKLALTTQYTFLASPDLANQVMPWLQAEVYAVRHWSVLLWTPYEWFGQSLIGQVQPGVVGPFTFLLALAPIQHGQIQPLFVQLWFVLIHCAAGLFAYWFLADLGCAAGAAAVGGILYATAGFCGNTDWPQHLASGIWAPLVFLFLLRSLRGRAPLKSAAWCGVALAMAWMSGHHAPPLAITLAVAGVGAAALWRPEHRREAAIRLAVVFLTLGLVSAVQILPAAEYGKEAKRWTATGALTWQDKVEIPEHEDSGLRPNELLHIIMPGGEGLRTDPFVGIVGLSLAAIAVWGAFRRPEVRLLLLLAVAALLCAMARNNPLYGLLYVFVPLVEKSRAPIVALCVFSFAVASLAGLGADLLVRQPDPRRERKIVKALLWFGGITFGLFTLMQYAKPGINSTVLDGDPRPAMIGLIALLLAGVYHAFSGGYIRPAWALALVGLLVVVEQGNEVGYAWAHYRETARTGLVRALTETQDLADFLRTQVRPIRLEINDQDVHFSFGDWYRIDAAHAMTASMLTQTSELGGWWVDRTLRMYGMNWVVSRTPTRPGLEERFTGRTGIKVWFNPAAFERAWTVHRIVVAPNDAAGRDLVREGPFDLRTTAVTVGSEPRLDSCAGPDQVTGIDERPSSVEVNVEMACRGLLVVSDNWYPGWRAGIDGQSAPIWKVNTVIRGVVVGPGRHTVTMKYQPFSVYFGLLLTIAGLAGAVIFQRRKEKDRVDVLFTPSGGQRERSGGLV